MKTFSLEEIQSSDGKNTSPAMVVVKGIVYDVSASKKWPGGLHMRRHQAGRDLTAEIGSAPHGMEVLERVNMVGTYEPKPITHNSQGRVRVEAFLEKYPFFRRHPHPAVVHFPLALLIVGCFFEIVAVWASSYKTEWAAYLVLALGTTSLPIAMGTGYMTWWINYEGNDNPIVRQKRRMAWLALSWGILAIALRTLLLPNPLNLSDPVLLIYLLLVFSQSGLVSLVGYLGGKLTFPY